ncbi:MAG: hypothetical protein KME42_19130 [Tildeniella nuda ZEHNDER 1965/U140]|jgi:hypothetical protein|nr:hypothetical protein [Tildeniella nuda ZEHNDER 1965/U140]
MGNQMLGKVLTKQLIMQVLKKVGVRLAAKQVAKYIPIAGQAVSATLSFAAMKYVCNSHIDDYYKIAQRVITQIEH